MAATPTRDDLLAEARALHGAGRFAEAEALYRRRLADAPDDLEIRHLYGVARHQQGADEEAVAEIEAVLAVRPGFAAAWQNLVLPLIGLGRLDAAIAAGRRAVALAPEKSGVRINLARALILAERTTEAEAVVDEALARTPDDPIVLCQKGHLVLAAGRAAEAEPLFARAAARAPDHVEAHYDRGVALQALLRDAEAVAAYRRTLELEPDHRGARLNLGVALRALGRVDAALKVWAGFAVSPDDWPELAYDIACAHLLAGDWPAAWPRYEARLQATRPFARPPATGAPMWDGAALPDATLLVHHEQGLGDTVQFVRFLPRLLDRVGRLVFVCQPPLAALLATSPIFADPARIALVPEGSELPPHVAWTPLLSIPGRLALGPRNVPADRPWLVADPARVARWREHAALTRPAALRVGLVWQGNPKAPVEKGRSIPLAAFAPLAEVAGLADVAFVALQKGAGREQTPPAGLDLADLGPDFDAGSDAFLDTVAVAASLDLVITSDTAMAHVAAALGRPVWLIVKKVPEWRWGLAGSRSPWYPTLRIFRQTSAGDWAAPIAAVAADLARLAAVRGAPLDPGATAADLFAGGLSAHGRGDLADAARRFAAAARAAPADGRALNFLAMVRLGAGPDGLAEAGATATHSVALSPDEPDLLANLAVVLRRSGDGAGARVALDRALTLAPTHRAATINLLNLDVAEGRAAEAAIRAVAAVAAFPRDAGVLAAAAEALIAADRRAEAESALLAAIAAAPSEARHRVSLGRVRALAEDHDGAARAWEEALVLDPTDADALSNLGVHERNRGETGLALWFGRAAVAARPDHADAWSNLGIAAGDRERPEEARAAFARAIALQPDHADARMAHGMTLLAEGRWREGFPDYEARLASRRLGLDARPAGAPAWTGGDPAGKRLLLVAEQGFGDAIQFIRYAGLLKARGAASIHVGARNRLAALLSTATGVDGIVVEGEKLPPVDAVAQLMSLPLFCGTTVDDVPAAVPYLAAEPERVTAWARRLATRDGFRIGLVWQGNPDPTVDRGRSIALSALAPLAAIPGVRLIALQKGPGVEQIAEVADRMAVEDLGDGFDAGPHAFLDTAAVMANLDLVISTDTAAAHLAGALGRPTWILLKAKPEWRWLDGTRTDSPWYPTVRLFRQPASLDPSEDRWAPVVADLAREVAALVAGDRSRLVDRTPAPPVPARPRPSTEARFQAALSAHRAGRRAEAAHAYAEILAEDGAHGEALHMTGVLAFQAGLNARALVFYDHAARAGLASPELKSNRAVSLRALGRSAEAEALFAEVMATAPMIAAAIGRGNALRDLDRIAEAIDAFAVATRLDPTSSRAWRGLGNALRDAGRLAEAIGALDTAVARDPADPEARLDRAHALLQAGRLAEGFEDYRARWRAAEMKPHGKTAPEWDGAPLAGRTLLVHGEQGLGDNIQFARFLVDAAGRGGRLVVEMRRPLLGLLAALPLPAGADVRWTAQGTQTPAHDLQVPLLDLPRVLGRADLAAVGMATPYLAAREDRLVRWRAALGDERRFTVGLVWQGNPVARADRGRSPGLPALAPLLALDGIRFLALQKDHGLDQLGRTPYAERIVRFGADFDVGPDAFLDTAAVMSLCDLVVSVDTATAHLAGALGRPTFVLLKAAADWRWLDGRADSPWYPSLRLFRQTAPGDWSAPIAALAAAIAALRDDRLDAAAPHPNPATTKAAPAKRKARR